MTLQQLRDKQSAARGRKALDNAPDWFGCGRKITQDSWNRFLAARAEYYRKQDDEGKESNKEPC